MTKIGNGFGCNGHGDHAAGAHDTKTFTNMMAQGGGAVRHQAMNTVAHVGQGGFTPKVTIDITITITLSQQTQATQHQAGNLQNHLCGCTHVNAPVMNYGVGQMQTAMDTLQPILQNLLGALGQATQQHVTGEQRLDIGNLMSSLTQVLTLVRNLMTLMGQAGQNGYTPQHQTPVFNGPADLSGLQAALQKLTSLQDLLGQLQGATEQVLPQTHQPAQPYLPAPAPAPMAPNYGALPEMAEGKWAANHGGGYKKTGDGEYEVTKGALAGHTLSWNADLNKYVVYDNHDCAVGVWTPKHDKNHDKVASPIAFDMNGDGKIGVTGETTAKDGVRAELGRTVDFDIDADGQMDKIEWMAGDGDALLVDNRDGNAANDMDGARLFGDEGGKFSDGYAKLAGLDTNGDKVLTAGELQGLMLWRDNGNARVDAGEMISAAEAGVTRISTERQDVTDENGDTLMRSTAQVAGEDIMTEDVWFGQED